MQDGGPAVPVLPAAAGRHGLPRPGRDAGGRHALHERAPALQLSFLSLPALPNVPEVVVEE